MIVKYDDEGAWGYIDNIRQVGKREIDVYELEKEFDKTPNVKDPPESYLNGEKLPDEICTVNKAFTMATMDIPNDGGRGSHCENKLDCHKLDYPASIIMLYLDGVKEYDIFTIVTNQSVYLMNDDGKTVERLN